MTQASGASRHCLKLSGPIWPIQIHFKATFKKKKNLFCTFICFVCLFVCLFVCFVLFLASITKAHSVLGASTSYPAPIAADFGSEFDLLKSKTNNNSNNNNNSNKNTGHCSLWHVTKLANNTAMKPEITALKLGLHPPLRPNSKPNFVLQSNETEKMKNNIKSNEINRELIWLIWLCARLGKNKTKEGRQCQILLLMPPEIEVEWAIRMLNVAIDNLNFEQFWNSNSFTTDNE